MPSRPRNGSSWRAPGGRSGCSTGPGGVFWVFSLLVLPGTFAHEACHLVLGLLLNGRPAGFNLLPRRKGGAGRWVR